MADKKDIKRYKCTNYGACNAANNNQVIEIDAIETLGGTPDCPHCQQHTLEEIVKKPFPTKLIAIIAAVVAVIGGGVGTFFTLSGGDGQKDTYKIKLSEKSLNFVIGSLLDLRQIGIRLTESGAMRPHASVSGLMIAHPQARYFSIGKIGEDQLRDYALRRGLPLKRPF